MALDLGSFKKAVGSLERALQVACSPQKMAGLDKDQKETIRAGVIQNFKFTYELSWKFMKRWLERNLGSTYVDGLFRRELFRLSIEHQLINNIENWMVYHEARSQTAHTYDEIKAQEVFETAQGFLNDAQILPKSLETKND